MTTNSIVSKKELIADLRRVRNLVRKPSLARSAYRSLGRHASSTVESHFSNWSKAKRTAGIR